MKTTVAPDAVTVRLGFLDDDARSRTASIARAEAVVYRPIRDYGGWGIRGFGRRRALNARGNHGVLHHRGRDGSTLLIGSQTPRALLSALPRAGRSHRGQAAARHPGVLDAGESRRRKERNRS